MEDQLGALGLVLNCITLWNTLYLDHALDALRAQGYPVLDADAARLSAYQYKHINVYGHYWFPRPVRGGPPPPLRAPAASEQLSLCPPPLLPRAPPSGRSAPARARPPPPRP